MPAKAAGTSMEEFTKECMGLSDIENFANFPEKLEKFFSETYTLPTIIASHMRCDTTLMSIIKSSTRNSLILYMHRQESDRVLSGIRHILTTRICGHEIAYERLTTKYGIEVQWTNQQCILEEGPVIRMIKDREIEIAFGAADILTCDLYDSIRDNTPSNLVFVSHTQADKVQQLLKKHHCPDLIQQPPVHTNISNEKSIEVYLRLQNSKDNQIVPLTEWLEKKKNLIEWALNLKHTMTCQGKTYEMEDHLFSCPDGAVKLYQNEYYCVTLDEWI